MEIYETTNKRIQELRKRRRLSERTLIYRATMPPSTMKSILHGKNANPSIVNIKKIAEGLGTTIEELHDSEIFDDLEQED